MLVLIFCEEKKEIDFCEENHDSQRFPFLNQPFKFHEQYYATLGAVLFTDQQFSHFNVFFSPFNTSLTLISQKSDEKITSAEFYEPLLDCYMTLKVFYPLVRPESYSHLSLRHCLFTSPLFFALEIVGGKKDKKITIRFFLLF